MHSFFILIGLLLSLPMLKAGVSDLVQHPGESRSTRAVLSAGDQAFLEDLSRRSFRYFEEQTDPRTGLVRDRARADGVPHGEEQNKIASIAATGFGLTAWCIAAERGWVSQGEARGRVLAALRFFADRQEHKEG